MTTAETTTHIQDPEGNGMGRLPKKMYAVRIVGTNPKGRKTSVVFTHERKPLAARQHLICTKAGMQAELLEGEVTWTPMN